MKFSVTVQFDYLALQSKNGLSVNPDSEVGRLATACNVMLRDRSRLPNSFYSYFDKAEQSGEYFCAMLLTMMAAHDKLTELRILHSILTTYTDFLGSVIFRAERDIRCAHDLYQIEIELHEHAWIAVDVGVDGKPLKRRVRQIDMLERPNRDGDLIARETMANAPRRRMRLNRE